MTTSHSYAVSSTASRKDNGCTTSQGTTSCVSRALATTPHKKRPRRIYQPAANSLYDIFDQHSGTALFVRPIYWTDLHAELLGVNWEELPLCDAPQHTVSPEPLGSLNIIITLFNALGQILLPEPMHPILTSVAVTTALMALWPNAFNEPHYLPDFHLYFGGVVYCNAVSAQVLWNFPPVMSRPNESPNNLPMMCYIGKAHLELVRNRSFGFVCGPGRPRNDPAFRLQQLRARMLTPLQSDHDPYFVGVFLGMAQKHFYPSTPINGRLNLRIFPGQGIPPCPNFHSLKLWILTHDTDRSEFIVYTGYITKEFLKQFHDPFKAPLTNSDPTVPGIKIEYSRVSMWPLLGLRERLGQALGQEVIQTFNQGETRT